MAHDKMIRSEFKLLRQNFRSSEIYQAKTYYKIVYMSLMHYFLEDLKGKSHALPVMLDHYLEILDLKKEDLLVVDAENRMELLEMIKKTKMKVFSFLSYRYRDYRYLLLLEAFYFRTIITDHVDLDLFEAYFSLLKRNGKKKEFIIDVILNPMMNKVLPADIDQKIVTCSNKQLRLTCNAIVGNMKMNAKYSALPKLNVAVCATMSSGKSTFVNALLGKDYIPARNEACTAKITSISDNDHLDSIIGVVIDEKLSHACRTNIDAQTLEEWNADDNVREILLESNLGGISVKNGIVTIHDTPGTNYSQDQSHHNITMDFLNNNQIDMIICIINAEHVSTIDNKLLLQKLKTVTTEKRIGKVLFLVNKIDSFDREKDDDIKACLRGIYKELESYGYKTPMLIPISANAARLFKMAINEQKLSKRETVSFMNLFELFYHDKLDLNKHSSIGNGPELKLDANNVEIQVGDKAFKKNDICIALHRTGIVLVEYILEKIINITGGSK